MKVLKKALKGIALTLGSLLVLLVFLLGLLWWQPGLLLNETRVRQALRYAPAGTQVNWKSFRWDFKNEGLLAKSMLVDLGGLCFRQDNSLSGCFERLHLDLSFSVSGLRPRITRLGAFVVESSELYVRSENKPEEPAKEPLPDLRLPAFTDLFPADVDLSKVGEVKVRLERLLLENPGQEALTAHLELVKVASEPGSLKLEILGDAQQGKALQAKLQGALAVAPERFSWRGRGEGEASGWKFLLPLEIDWQRKLELHGKPLVRKGKDQFTTPLNLSWESTRIALSWGKLEFSKLWPKRVMALDACEVESRLNQSRGYPERTQLACELAILHIGQGGLVLPPMRAALKADLALKPLSRDLIAADLRFEERGDNPYLVSRVQFSGSSKFSVSRGEVEGDPKMDFQASFRVPSIDQWRKALDRTPLAVPAPFRTLQGPLELALKLEHATPQEALLTAKFQSDLHGAVQALVTESSAEVRVKNPWRGPRALDVKAQALLADVLLEAPPLRLEAPPKPLPDKRFFETRIPAPPPKVSSMPLTWKVHVATRNPLRIRTNLLETPIPIALNLDFSSEQAGMDGTVQVLEMPVAIFAKKAQVQNVKATFRAGSQAGELNGRIDYRNPEVLVKILLLGSTERPRVEFVSDPPLTRQQVVSVLLFNKSVDELNEEEASSAGSFSQATADGALGLFSLFFLSKTPIESISYDPISQTYAARLRVDDKTSVSVGSDFDQERQVALRRRLGGRWAIRTELQNEEGRPDVVLTLLEWFKRF